MTKEQIGNISTAFSFNSADVEVARNLAAYKGEPEAKVLDYFVSQSSKLTNYGYWYMLSTIWVWGGNINGDIDAWRQLFSSARPDKKISLMKPDELEALKKLPNKLVVYRAPSKNGGGGLSYTMSFDTAAEFSSMNDSDYIVTGRIKKRDITALFLRRDESELIITDSKLIHGMHKMPIFRIDNRRETK